MKTIRCLCRLPIAIIMLSALPNQARAVRLTAIPSAGAHYLSGERGRRTCGEAQCASGGDGEPLHHNGEPDLSANRWDFSQAFNRGRASCHLEIRQCLSYASRFRRYVTRS